MATSKCVSGVISANARRAVSENAFDGTLISDTGFEMLASEDLSVTRLRAIDSGKRTLLLQNAEANGLGLRTAFSAARAGKTDCLANLIEYAACLSSMGHANGRRHANLISN
jgi:hypothetical protein